MFIGEKLKELREHKRLSHGDIEKRTVLLRCYISRAGNGHTVPALEPLEKIAHALEIPLYQLFTKVLNGPPVLKLRDTTIGWAAAAAMP